MALTKKDILNMAATTDNKANLDVLVQYNNSQINQLLLTNPNLTSFHIAQINKDDIRDYIKNNPDKIESLPLSQNVVSIIVNLYIQGEISVDNKWLVNIIDSNFIDNYDMIYNLMTNNKQLKIKPNLYKDCITNLLYKKYPYNHYVENLIEWFKFGRDYLGNDFFNDIYASDNDDLIEQLLKYDTNLTKQDIEVLETSTNPDILNHILKYGSISNDDNTDELIESFRNSSDEEECKYILTKLSKYKLTDDEYLKLMSEEYNKLHKYYGSLFNYLSNVPIHVIGKAMQMNILNGNELFYLRYDINISLDEANILIDYATTHFMVEKIIYKLNENDCDTFINKLITDKPELIKLLFLNDKAYIKNYTTDINTIFKILDVIDININNFKNLLHSFENSDINIIIDHLKSSSKFKPHIKDILLAICNSSYYDYNKFLSNDNAQLLTDTIIETWDFSKDWLGNTRWNTLIKLIPISKIPINILSHVAELSDEDNRDVLINILSDEGCPLSILEKYNSVSGTGANKIKQAIRNNPTFIAAHTTEKVDKDDINDVRDIIRTAISSGTIRQSDKDDLGITRDNNTIKDIWKSLVDQEFISNKQQKYVDLAKRSIE